MQVILTVYLYETCMKPEGGGGGTKDLKFQLWYGVGCMLTQLNDPHFKSLTYHNPKCKHDKNAGNTHTPHP